MQVKSSVIIKLVDNKISIEMVYTRSRTSSL